ncbi:MAG: DUF4105 domain-containing protein [Bacteroidales bacterium]|nr:DUF4105 domain-containing protein [Bacteroidales bacterium]
MPLSETATASVLTCGPGDDFYTTFGHSAIRICDTAKGIDLVYNYGTFDFNTPHFYWKFMRGQLDYMLGRSSFEGFMEEYIYYGRAVWEQRLNFTPREVCNLFLLLEQNYLPEYRHYRYDFFRDNCATRVRDMVELACGKDSPQRMDGDSAGRVSTTYRHMVAEPLKGTLEWWRLGIDILFGLPADHRCTEAESMMMPENMKSLFGAYTRRDGRPLVSGDVNILGENRTPLSQSFPPVVVFALVLAGVALLTWKRLWPRWADRVLFILAGVVGLFLLFMWFGTDHYCTEWNLNILWASPLLILIAIRLERSPKWALWIQEGCFAVAAVWVIMCGLTLALVPLILTLALRVGVLIKN